MNIVVPKDFIQLTIRKASVIHKGSDFALVGHRSTGWRIIFSLTFSFFQASIFLMRLDWLGLDRERCNPQGPRADHFSPTWSCIFLHLFLHLSAGKCAAELAEGVEHGALWQLRGRELKVLLKALLEAGDV